MHIVCTFCLYNVRTYCNMYNVISKISILLNYINSPTQHVYAICKLAFSLRISVFSLPRIGNEISFARHFIADIIGRRDVNIISMRIRESLVTMKYDAHVPTSIVLSEYTYIYTYSRRVVLADLEIERTRSYN